MESKPRSHLDHPNILFFYTDQHRADSIGAISPWMKTPYLDQLRSDGVLFTNCYSPSPACIPSRFSLLRGLYPHNTKTWANNAELFPSEASNWVRELRDAGYHTHLIGTSHLYPYDVGSHLAQKQDYLKQVGFDTSLEIGGPRASRWTESALTEYWRKHGVLAAFRADITERYETNPLLVRPSPLTLEHHYDRFVGKHAEDFVLNYEGDKPWFCWVGFPGPHEPWDTPAPFASYYHSSSVPKAKPPIDFLPRSSVLTERIRHSTKIGARDADTVSALRADYAGAVSLIDQEVGRVLEALKERDLYRDTIVVFTSDHGEMNGDHGLAYKETFFDEAAKVPFIVKLQGKKKSAVNIVDAPVEAIDIGTTLLDLADVPSEKFQQSSYSRSLAPHLTEGASLPKSRALSELRGEIMMVNSRWKIAVNDRHEPYLLYDLEKDPCESKNLIDVASEQSQLEKELWHLVSSYS